MKIKVSKVFADYINKVAKKAGFEVFARVVKLTENEYRYYVGYPYDADYYGDYNWNTGKYSAIALEYPWDYYAPTRYLSTRELHEEFERQHVRDVTSLDAMIRDICEI